MGPSNRNVPMPTEGCSIAEPMESKTKVLKMHEAIRSIGSVCDRLDAILMAIRGDVPVASDKDCKVDSLINLQYVLNSGREDIHGYVELCHNQLSELEELTIC